MRTTTSLPKKLVTVESEASIRMDLDTATFEGRNKVKAVKTRRSERIPTIKNLICRINYYS